MSKIKKAYIGGALTHADEKQKILYKKISKLCENMGIEAYVPHVWGTDPVKHPDVSPEDVWHINKRQVSSANIMIAFVGKPSLGVGAELEIARINNVKIIIWWFEGEKVSRMTLGNPGVIKKIEAEDEKDLFNRLEQTLEKIYGK